MNVRATVNATVKVRDDTQVIQLIQFTQSSVAGTAADKRTPTGTAGLTEERWTRCHGTGTAATSTPGDQAGTNTRKMEVCEVCMMLLFNCLILFFLGGCPIMLISWGDNNREMVDSEKERNVIYR